MASASRKRALKELEISNSAPPSKRQETEPKSPKTAIRDASKALIEAIKKAEEVYLPPANSDLKGSSVEASKASRKQDKRLHSEKIVKFEFEKDNPAGLPYIYIVLEKLIYSKEDVSEEILSTFASLEDANNFVRNHCAKHAKRDDPDALFSERMSTVGRISWEYEDEAGCRLELRIEKCILNSSGSVPAEDWGRPIGAPCPPKEDSELESSSFMEWSRCTRKIFTIESDADIESH